MSKFKNLKGPATDKQKNVLNKLEIYFKKSITKQQAHDLIEKEVNKMKAAAREEIRRRWRLNQLDKYGFIDIPNGGDIDSDEYYSGDY